MSDRRKEVLRNGFLSHKEFSGGGFPVAAVGGVPGAVPAVGPARELLVLLLVQIPLLGQTRDVLLQLLHLALERALLALQHVPLLHALVAAGLRVAAVLQGTPLLLEADDLLLAEASQLAVELPHRHADQLLVRESILQPGVVAMVVVVMDLVVVPIGRR